jgi:ATP-dependent phosphofructokinase / diphosphate-dependent phosphofructokinase
MTHSKSEKEFEKLMNVRKRVGVLTSGGDCPGLNAVIRAVVKCATRKGWEVYGIPYGTDGLIQIARDSCAPEDLRLREHGCDLPGILHGLDILQFLSGSILGSLSKGNPNDPAIARDILQGYQRLNLDALIAIGGDGSIEIIYDLAQQGQWNLIAIPKTIDNDVPFTERSVGFDTAVESTTKAIYDLTFTAASHERVMIVQVMGRDAGHLALHSGIAGGADIILIPELTPHLTEPIVHQCCLQISQLRQEGRQFALVVIAEGVKNHAEQKEKYIGDYLADWIKVHSKKLCDTGNEMFCGLHEVDTRVTSLGHLQRSGTPSSFDRLLATEFGIKAVDLIEQERYSQLAIWKNGEVHSIPLEEAIPIIKRCHREKRCPRPVRLQDFMLQTARSLGIYVGDLSEEAIQFPSVPSESIRSA